jgi:PAS domain S-box-containing protein
MGRSPPCRPGGDCQRTVSRRVSDVLRTAERSALARYGSAVGLVGAGAAMSLVVLPVWNDALFAALLFFPVVAVSAWFGGFGPGLLAVVGSAVAMAYFWLPPRYSFAIERVADVVALVMFCAMGLVIVSLHERRLRQAVAVVIALRRSEHRYRILFEENVAAICILGPSGTLEDCNEAFIRLLGYETKAEVVGRPPEIFCLDPSDSTALLALVGHRTLVVRREMRWCARHGAVVPVVINARDVDDGRVQVTAIHLSDRAPRSPSRRTSTSHGPDG